MIKRGKLLKVTDGKGKGLCMIYIDDEGDIVIDHGRASFALTPDDWEDIISFVEGETPCAKS